MQPDEKRQLVQEVISKIQEMPVWTNIPPDKSVDSDKIMEVLHEIDQYGSEVIREAITAYYNSTGSLEDMGRLLLLNKFLFNLPEWVSSNSYRPFGGWFGVPEEHDRVNLLWPFTLTENGSLVLARRFEGYMGEAYLAIEAFDYYLKTFGRRNRQADDKASN